MGTTTLLSSGRLEPRKVIGSIDTSEFVVAVGGSLGFLVALWITGIVWAVRQERRSTQVAQLEAAYAEV